MSKKQEYNDLKKAHRTFSNLMKDKLLLKAQLGWNGWNDPRCKEAIERKLFINAMQLVKGDIMQAIDVANLAMFLWAQEQIKHGADYENAIGILRALERGANNE